MTTPFAPMCSGDWAFLRWAADNITDGALYEVENGAWRYITEGPGWDCATYGIQPADCEALGLK
jgi:hypothetical protein